MKNESPAALVVVTARGAWHAMQPMTGHAAITSALKKAGAVASMPQSFAEDSSSFTLRVDPDRAEDVASSMRGHPLVQTAYVVRPAPMRGIFKRDGLAAGDAAAMAIAPPPPAPPQTPDLFTLQKHLQVGEGGVEAEFAWQQPGGRGTGVTVLDIEYAWDLDHEDLSPGVMEMPGSVMCEARPEDSDHGTAVLGLLGAVHDQKGVKGICPDATVRVFSHCGAGYIAGAIDAALPALRPGDIILLEAQNFAPHVPVPTTRLVPVEWWFNEWSAIRRAVAAGVVVVSCGANGGIDLDDPVFDQPLDPAWLQRGWENPFRRTARGDSGSILVGSGIPRFAQSASAPDASRCPESNFGACLDTQQWGLETVSSGYGMPASLNFGPRRQYMQFFGGTSGAGALVAGLLGCVQGMLKAQGLRPLDAAEARRVLRSVGTAQTSAPNRPNTQRIGTRATVREAHAAALALR